MDPQMVYAEVKKMGFKTRICDYERVTQGEAGIRFWKVTGTKTKVFRKWLRRSYVPTSQLTDVDAEERRQKYRLWFKQNYVPTSQRRH
jgi:hypothetical protein